MFCICCNGSIRYSNLNYSTDKIHNNFIYSLIVSLFQSFKSFFLRMNEPIDLYEYLVNEALLLIHKKDSSTAEPETSELRAQECVEDFLDLISEVRPELMEMTPNPDLIPRLIQSSNKIESSSNYKNQGRNNFRGRGGGNRGGRGVNRGCHVNPDNNERRGRFSVANQREREQDGRRAVGGERGGGTGEREGNETRRVHRGWGQNENWRQRSRNNEEQSSKEDHKTWRKK